MKSDTSGKVHGLGILLLALGSIIGLTAYLLFGSLIGLTYPLWWGGEAFLPRAQGLMTILMGVIPFYVVAQLVLKVRHDSPSMRKAFIVGVLIGIALIPGQQAFSFVLKAFPSSDGLAPMTAFFLVSGAAGILIAAIAAFVISTISRRRDAI